MNIEEIFSDLNYIKDFYVTKDKVYFSTDRNITYNNLYKDIKKYDCNVDKYKYIQLPFIPIDKSGDFSIEKLENIGYIASDTLDLLENSLKSNGIDSEISIEYINNESNIKEAFKKEENVVKNIKSQKKAIALNGDIEETEFKYKNLSSLIFSSNNFLRGVISIPCFFLALLFFMPFPSSCLFPSLFLIFLYLFILLASSFSLSFSAFSLLRLLGLPVPSAVFRRLFPLSFFVMKFSLLLIGSILISLP